MRIKNPFIIFIIGIVITAVLAGILLKGKSSDGQMTEMTINPHYGPIQAVITTTGTILPKNRLEIKPPVSGRVDKILVAEGDMVKTGQVLAWMSSTDRAALLDAARGEGPKEYKKWQDVYKPIPLLAPIDAQVIVAKTQPGQTVANTDAVVVLSDRLIARAQVDETDIRAITINQGAMITLEASPDTKINAIVDHIYYESTIVDNVTVYNVDLLLQHVPAFFRSGMNASVDFIIQLNNHALLIPASAVNNNGDRNFVWLKDPGNNKPVTREVKTGINDDKNIEIISGLQENDHVLVKIKKFSLNNTTIGYNPFSPFKPPAKGR